MDQQRSVRRDELSHTLDGLSIDSCRELVDFDVGFKRDISTEIYGDCRVSDRQNSWIITHLRMASGNDLTHSAHRNARGLQSLFHGGGNLDRLGVVAVQANRIR